MEFQNSQLGPTTNNYKNINRVGGKAYNSAYTGCSSNQTTEQSQAKRSNKEIYLYQQTTWVQDTKPTLLPDWKSVHMADHRHALWMDMACVFCPAHVDMERLERAYSARCEDDLFHSMPALSCITDTIRNELKQQ